MGYEEQRNAFCTKHLRYSISILSSNFEISTNSFWTLISKMADAFPENRHPAYRRHPSNYCSNGPYYHHKPQFIRVGEWEHARVAEIRKPKADKSEFNYDQLFDELSDSELEGLDSNRLYGICRNMTRILELPSLVQDLDRSKKYKDSVGFERPSDEEMRRLIRNRNAHIARAKLQCRPIERGVCVGYWKHSRPPFRHAVHATQEREGKIVLRVAETNEQGIYQGPVPWGIPLPLLWADVILAERFDFTSPEIRNDAIKKAIHWEVARY